MRKGYIVIVPNMEIHVDADDPLQAFEDAMYRIGLEDVSIVEEDD